MAAGTGGSHDQDNYELGVRIAVSWSEIRRGAGMGVVRDYLFGTGEDRLDQGQMDSLDLLAQQPSWRMAELADALRVDPSTATRAVQRLVNVGLATRRASDADGRVVIVEITADGRHRHADVARRRMDLMNHMLKAFRPAERPILAAMLERFIAAVDDFVADVTVHG
ncbi:MAG: putative MarR family transcriptional regulator [Ilumatobacteraceae bacterium]|jgi:DNA-binding MarR family transcriptional regulator|nr:putative MarR family transcriptional regulator [Ilumatobacteraceae bacterium]